MFKKLLSNLPFNPSLIQQVSFYAQRMHREEAIRRSGLLLFVFAFMLQFFVVLSPPQHTLAGSSNDIIFGGIGTTDPKTGWYNAYNSNDDRHGHRDIQAIYNYFQITPEDVRNSWVGTINSNDHSLYSLGRNPHSTLDQVQHIPGAGTTYLRPLHSWGANKNYRALIGSRSKVNGTAEDKYFAIIIDCGNIVIKVRPKPRLAIAKRGLNHSDNATVFRNEELKYRVFFSNIGAGNAHEVLVRDIIPDNTTYVIHGTGAANSIVNNATVPKSPGAGYPPLRYIDWRYNVMQAGKENWYVDLTVRVNNNVVDGTKICNAASIGSVDHWPVQSNKVCYTVSVPPIPAKTPMPTPPVIVPETPVLPVPQPGQPDISKSKLVSNLTQGQNDAHNQTAAPGDILEYKVLTINTGTAKAPGFGPLTDNVNDILDYANVTEISDGGELKDGVITWKAVDVDAGATVTRSFKIKVHDDISGSPVAKSDPASYDLQMDNVYGNKVTVKVASPSVPKTVETTTGKLPETGPGETMLFAIAAIVFIGYFFARTHLFAKELDLVKVEYATNGGN